MDNQNQIFSEYSLQQAQTHSVSKSFMANVFLWMGGALLISAVCAWMFATNDTLLAYLVSNTGLTTLGKVTIFAPIIFVLIMSFGYNRLSAPAMAMLFITYAAVNGISFSFILLVYQIGSIFTCFLSAAAMFLVMAVMGYTTNKDLTSFGRILRMAVIGILVAMLINYFMHSPQMDYIISLIGVAVFTGLTAYDVQKLKRIGAGIELNNEGGEAVARTAVSKLSIYGALTLYLDFINLFLFMLRLFGRRR